jgi:hypothetical protein
VAVSCEVFSQFLLSLNFVLNVPTLKTNSTSVCKYFRLFFILTYLSHLNFPWKLQRNSPPPTSSEDLGLWCVRTRILAKVGDLEIRGDERLSERLSSDEFLAASNVCLLCRSTLSRFGSLTSMIPDEEISIIVDLIKEIANEGGLCIDIRSITDWAEINLDSESWARLD